MNNTLTNQRNWIGSPSDPLKGFSWKSGSIRHTSGVVFWSDVFLHDRIVDGKEEKIAIVLMDTQGLFDAKTSPTDNSRIFALGTFLSSMQIFNLNGRIQEYQLEYLQMATDYAKFVARNSVNKKSKPFQSLLFLMRDWFNIEDFDYGLSGGQMYIGKILKNQRTELRDVSKHIGESFDEVSCFLLPHPGRGSRGQSFDGRYSMLDDEFVTNLKVLIEWMYSPDNLKKKRIFGKEVTGKSFGKYAKTYFKSFRLPNMPLISSVYEATIQSQLSQFVEESLESYKLGMKFYEDKTCPNFTEWIEVAHQQERRLAVQTYKNERKVGTEEHELKYLAILEKKISASFLKWKENVLSTHNKMDEETGAQNNCAAEIEALMKADRE